MTCWDYLAEAIKERRGCECNHGEGRHYLRVTGKTWEHRKYGLILYPVEVDYEQRCECSMCDCSRFRWNRLGYGPDGTLWHCDSAA